MRKIILLCTVNLISGCAASMPHRTVKPCIAKLPDKQMILLIKTPSPVPYEQDGVDKIAMSLVVDNTSIQGFFAYVEALEEVAKKAYKCVEK